MLLAIYCPNPCRLFFEKTESYMTDKTRSEGQAKEHEYICILLFPACGFSLNV